MANQTLWGIDLGGTKIEGVVLAPGSKPKVVNRQRIATESSKGYDHVLNQIKSLVLSLSKESGQSPGCIGFGTPGAIDPSTQLLRGSNSRHLNHRPLKKDLERILGIPVAMENDANCFALAESRMGVVRQSCPNAKVVFGVILGTGVGGGIVVNGKLIRGKNSTAGEWGHNYLHHSGEPCYCGRIGCVETIISGPALERFYTDLTRSTLPLPTIVELSAKGDNHARTTLQRLIKFFGLGIANVINVLDPDVIVIGGGVGNYEGLYTRGVAEVAKYTFAQNCHTSIVKPRLGDSAGVFGAAFLFEPLSH